MFFPATLGFFTWLFNFNTRKQKPQTKRNGKKSWFAFFRFIHLICDTFDNFVHDVAFCIPFVRFRKHKISTVHIHTLKHAHMGARNSRTRTIACKYLLSALFVAWEKCRYEKYTNKTPGIRTVRNRTGCHMDTVAIALREPTKSRSQDPTYAQHTYFYLNSVKLLQMHWKWQFPFWSMG